MIAKFNEVTDFSDEKLLVNVENILWVVPGKFKRKR